MRIRQQPDQRTTSGNRAAHPKPPILSQAATQPLRSPVLSFEPETTTNQLYATTAKHSTNGKTPGEPSSARENASKPSKPSPPSAALDTAKKPPPQSSTSPASTALI